MEHEKVENEKSEPSAKAEHEDKKEHHTASHEHKNESSDDKKTEKHSEHHESKKTEKKHESKKVEKSYFWPAVSAVLALLLIFSVYSGMDSKSDPVPINNIEDKSVFSAKMKDFVENTLLQGASVAEIENITEENGLYKFTVVIDGSPAAISYATKDASILFPQGGINVEEFKVQAKEALEKAKEEAKITASDTPKVQLFVMSECPYGIQAENALKPVLDKIGDKISFELKFIAKSDGKGGFTSLHGQPEVDENIRQVCAMENYPDKYFDYVVCRNKNIKNPDWQLCATEAGIDPETIKSCFEGDDGKALLLENIREGNQLGIGGSPTILINSKKYAGQRTADAFLNTICSAFNDAPEECLGATENLSAEEVQVPAEACGA